MITQSQAARMLSEFENEVQRVGYETCDKRTLVSLFGYLKIRCSDFTLQRSAQNLKAVQALELRWQRDRKGKQILGGQNEVLGYDPSGTGNGSLTIHGIIKELRALLSELPERIEPPAPQFWPAMMLPGTVPTAAIADAVNTAVATALAAQKRETVSV